MGSNPTNAKENIYFQCRKCAAAYNDKLNSREGAAELLGVSVSSLADYELDITKVVPVDKVKLMSDLYNAPKLENYYCSSVCPIGKSSVRRLDVTTTLDRLTIKIIAAFQNVRDIEDSLINIAADGKITENERPQLESILKELEAITQHSQELRMWADKNIKSI